MNTLYLLLLFGVCKTGPIVGTVEVNGWECVQSSTVSFSFAFGITPEQAWKEVQANPKVPHRLMVGQCAANTRAMSNLCIGNCDYTFKACDFQPAEVSSQTVITTQYLIAPPNPRP